MIIIFKLHTLYKTTNIANDDKLAKTHTIESLLITNQTCLNYVYT